MGDFFGKICFQMIVENWGQVGGEEDRGAVSPVELRMAIGSGMVPATEGDI